MKTSKFNIVVIGAQGMLGNYVFSYFSQQSDCKMTEINRSHFDVLSDDIRILEDMVQDVHDSTAIANIVVNCVGCIPHAKKQYTVTPHMLVHVNAIFPHMLAQICQRQGWRFVHPTTDCVYSGSKGAYSESNKPDEQNFYGVSKAAGEPQCATVIRTSIIGEERRNKRSLLEWVISVSGTRVNGFVNHKWNGVTCLQFAKIVDTIMRQGLWWEGTRHVLAPSPVTKCQLVQMISDVYDLGVTVEPVQHGPTIVDKTLSTDYPPLLDALSIPELEEQLKQLRQFTLRTL